MTIDTATGGAWHTSLRCRRVAALMTVALAACDSTNGALPEDTTPAPVVPVETTAVGFDTATITLMTAGGQVSMSVEVAERADQRAYGLMDRDALDAGAGMIFLYDQMQHQDTGFWMYRTRIPLDIAFFDGAGRIVAIHQMMPCTSLDPSSCPGYSAGVPYFGAVEANRGFFARHGVQVGDRVVMPGRIGGS